MAEVETQTNTSEMPIAITPGALDQIKRILAKKNAENAAIRIGVKAGGCSGMEYVLKLEENIRETDTVYELDGVKIVIDPKSPKFLEGTTLEWTGNLLGSGFAFNNPNAKRSCGCGTSFTV